MGHISTTRWTDQPVKRLIGPIVGVIPMAKQGIKALILTIRAAIDAWRATRRLLGADDAMLADIGVSRGNIDWLVHHGRQR
jgi:uncharacterized protein YjiS (DUF1127 family)